MSKSWEEMVQEVIIDGRPGDVASAALGWKELIKNLGEVKRSLETNVKDLGAVWKGPAYESFKNRIEEIAKDVGHVVEDAEKGEGIVQSLNKAAEQLTTAQQNMPIPAACVNDILEARNARLHIQVGFFEAKVKPDFLGLLDPITSLADWIFDRTEEARKVYEKVESDYQNGAAGMPGETRLAAEYDPSMETPDLDTDSDTSNVPRIGEIPRTGDMPKVGDVPKIGDTPKVGDTPKLGQPGQPELPDPGIYPPRSDEPPGTSLAGAGGTGAGLGSGSGLGGLGSGLGSGGGLGGGSLGSGGGLGGSAGGGAGGGLLGGGALGRAVTPGMMPAMMGGAGAHAGRGQSGSRRGAGGLGGGMAGGVGRGGVAGGGAGRGGTGGRGMGGGLAAMGPAGHGAGYGAEEHNHNSWLKEDEDVWGVDGGAPPGVLR